MNELEIYLDNYRKRSEELLKRSVELNLEINDSWKQIDENLKRECLELFNILIKNIDSIFENPDLREQFIKRIEIIEKDVLNKLLNYKKLYEKNYSEIVQNFILFRKKFEEEYIQRDKEYEIKKELLKESFNKIKFLLEKESTLKNTTSNKYLGIDTEFKEFNIFVKQKDMHDIQLSYSNLSRTYEDILQRKVILNKIEKLELTKTEIQNHIREVLEKKDRLVSIKSYQEASSYIKQNYDSYSTELNKYINMDNQITNSLKYEVGKFGAKTENRILNIYIKRYQKNVLHLKSNSEDFIRKRDELLEREYKKIVEQNYDKLIKLERESYKAVKLEGDKILLTEDLSKVNSYYQNNFIETSKFINASYIKIVTTLNKRGDIDVTLIEVKRKLKQIETKVIEELYNRKLEDDTYSVFRNQYIRDFKILINKNLAQDEKELLQKLNLIHKQNIEKIKSLEMIKKLELNADFDIEGQKIKTIENELQNNYKSIYAEHKVKQSKYSQIPFLSEISLRSLEVEKSRYQEIEKEICKKYLQIIEDKNKEKKTIVDEYTKVFNISLEKAKNDNGLSEELKRFKKYKIILPKIKNVELFLREQEKIKKIDVKGIITNLKMKLYLNTNKVIDYEGLKDD